MISLILNMFALALMAAICFTFVYAVVIIFALFLNFEVAMFYLSQLFQ